MRVDESTTHQSRNLHRRPLVIGLTGPIAAGKSTVAEHLRRRGAKVVDADQVYRSLLVPGSDLSERIVEHFGLAVVSPNGTIDRTALGGLVFGNAQALADLDRITHPIVVGEIRTLIAGSASPVVVVEAVKLAQSGLLSDVDSLWFVSADEETRLKRLLGRPGMDETKARARLAAASEVVPPGVQVDFSIDTSGDISETLGAVDDGWRALISNEREKRHDFVVSALEESS